MRIFLMILAFAIGLSGYIAATHALGDEACDPVTMMQMADQSDMDNADQTVSVAMKAATQDAGSKTADSNTAHEKCVDCHHCCASHAIQLSVASFDIPVQSPVFNMRLADKHDGDMAFALLRPPKSLV